MGVAETAIALTEPEKSKKTKCSHLIGKDEEEEALQEAHRLPASMSSSADDSARSHLMRAQLGFLCGVKPALRTPSHLMSSHLGFCARVLPHNPEIDRQQSTRDIRT